MKIEATALDLAGEKVDALEITKVLHRSLLEEKLALLLGDQVVAVHGFTRHGRSSFLIHPPQYSEFVVDVAIFNGTTRFSRSGTSRVIGHLNPLS